MLAMLRSSQRRSRRFLDSDRQVVACTPGVKSSAFLFFLHLPMIPLVYMVYIWCIYGVYMVYMGYMMYLGKFHHDLTVLPKAIEDGERIR